MLIRRILKRLKRCFRQPKRHYEIDGFVLDDEESLYRAVEHFTYTTYNHVRPHSYNGYRTPFEARYST